MPQFLRLRRRVHLKPAFRHPLLTAVLLTSIPVAVASILQQINTYTDKLFASSLEAGRVTALQYANSLGAAPRAALLMPVLMPLFPFVAKLIAEGRDDRGAAGDRPHQWPARAHRHPRRVPDRPVRTRDHPAPAWARAVRRVVRPPDRDAAGLVRAGHPRCVPDDVPQPRAGRGEPAARDPRRDRDRGRGHDRVRPDLPRAARPGRHRTRVADRHLPERRAVPVVPAPALSRVRPQGRSRGNRGVSSCAA